MADEGPTRVDREARLAKMSEYDRQLAEQLPEAYGLGYNQDDLTCGHRLHRDDRKDGKSWCSQQVHRREASAGV